MSEVHDLDITCPGCSSPTIEDRMEEQEFAYNVGDKQVVLKATMPVFICSICEFAYTDERAEIARHAAVCSYLGVLAPAEIIATRERLSLSRSEFAELTGFGNASIQRWETGSQIQSKSNDRLIRLMCNPGSVSILESVSGSSSPLNAAMVTSSTETQRPCRQLRAFTRLKNRTTLEAVAGVWQLRRS